MIRIKRYMFLGVFIMPSIFFSQVSMEISLYDLNLRIDRLDTNEIEKQIQSNLKKARVEKDTIGILYNQILETKLLILKKDYQNAVEYISQTLSMSKEYGNDSLIGLSYFYCADVFYELEDMLDASKMFNKAAESFIKSNSQEWECRVGMKSGLVKMVAYKFEDAIALYVDYIEKVKSNGFKLSIAGAYNNIGLCYISLKEYDLALTFLDSSLHFYQLKNNSIGIARVYNNKATVFLNLDNPKKALSFFEKGYEIRKKHKVGSSSYSESIINIGKAQLELGEIEKAKSSFEKGIAIANKIGSKELLKRGLDKLKEVYYIQKDYKKAFDVQARFYHLQDSLYGSSVREELIVYELSGEFNKKIIKDSIAKSQQELIHNEELRHQKAIQEQKNVNSLIIKAFLILVIIMIGWVFIIFYRRKQSYGEFYKHVR